MCFSILGAEWLREACSPGSVFGQIPTLLSFTRSSTPRRPHPPPLFPALLQDIARFLLVRGDYSWLGYVRAEVSLDCSSTHAHACMLAPLSVFVRGWCWHRQAFVVNPQLFFRVPRATSLVVTPKDSESLRHPLCYEYY